MNLEYKGRNTRGRNEWIDRDYYDESRPYEGFEMEEWKIPRYQELVETAESFMGRKLTKSEARTMNGLSSGENDTCQHIVRFIKEAHKKGNAQYSQIPRTIEEWREDCGDVLWWKFPIVEPPYYGTPLDTDWPEYHTHWTPIATPVQPI